VAHVSNVTDVDDKIINRANREERSWQDVAEECEAQWWAAMDALGALRPTVVPHASAYFPQMVALVEELVGTGKAYEIGDGVYLSVEQVDGYGLLAHQALESLRAGGGGRAVVGDEKRSPLDFVLWKKAKPGEPSWESPWGPGRPGWHTECVVMSLDLLGEGFDLHGAGQDLIFPHHENERAQAVALGRRFANHWMHNGMVEVGGQKMSKSLDNFTTIEEMLASGADPRAYRLLVARSHYRSPIEVGKEQVVAAGESLRRLDAFARLVEDLASAAPDLPAAGANPRAGEVRARFSAAMDDDLDSAGALAVLFDAVRSVNAEAGSAPGAALETGRVVLELLGVLGFSFPAGGSAAELPAEVADLVQQRDLARAARDWAAADAIRGRLVELGWTVEDTAGGTRVHR
jgi:cysteinyl-tRNA synthetase